MMDRPKHYCGIFGIFNVAPGTAQSAAEWTCLGLHALQHRGQEAAGIASAVYDEVKKRPAMPVHKGMGLVLDVFKNQRVFKEKLLGPAALGHTRYSTMGASDNKQNIQPFVVQYRGGNLALAHNGNLANARELRKTLEEKGTIFQSSSDSELILHLIAQSRKTDQIDQIMDALSHVEGAYSLIILTDDKLIAVRDPNGFRPLALGRLGDPHQEGGAAYCLASETCAFDIIGATYIRDIAPGELLVIDRPHCIHADFVRHELPKKYGVSHCVFEYIYFSRPDSRVFGEMTDKVRRKFGKQLAHESPPPTAPDGERTIVISVPDSSNTPTLGYVTESQKLGFDCRYEIGLIRNHYVGRTFIAPGQGARERKVRTKFNPVEGVLKDKIVVMVDDSIVRGTTCRALVKMVRDAGAREVHFRVASPPVKNPCYYGMDFPSREELFVHQFDGDLKAMEKWLGVDSLAYLSESGMMKAVAETNPTSGPYCDACFTGNYPVPVQEGVSKDEND